MYGEKLKKIRDYYGYSQRDLADKLEVPYSTLSFWERADYPSLEGIVKICEFFKINIWEFFIEDFEEFKKILPDFIETSDAAVMKLVNTRMDIETRIQVKKMFLDIVKLALAKDKDKLKDLPEYKALFGEEQF
ncbi:MAG TPA: helix-turn-helix transcriptional regulator [Spirochaetota bacterium]|nr:helix-turn-helix transcriptional regulator [Spirochaetota bacterium]HPF06817.1 helix-turn-helix transcriptional regulator [Spirochaetota bacterium]HPJ44311.1 helix-turn-helix transcriptional regulator [Spirochaetota bacterium]HRX48470.1 helix-turn-helix transcriptional regulator [Spirochaetota bacterium]